MNWNWFARMIWETDTSTEWMKDATRIERSKDVWEMGEWEKVEGNYEKIRDDGDMQIYRRKDGHSHHFDDEAGTKKVVDEGV